MTSKASAPPAGFGDKVEAAYRRGELLEKRKELADVSKYCAGQTVCEEVVTLRGDGR
jgi:hypothetical protein